MATEIGEGRSETEAMAELVSLMWERYIAPRAKKELLGHALDGYKAQVVENNEDGTLTVIRPFDSTSVTLRCPPMLAETAEPGDQVLVVALGNMSNAFVLCTTDMQGFGSKEDRVTELDFSNVDGGSFSVTWEDGTENIYTIERDAQERITSIVNTSSGFTTEVVWE